MPRALILAGTGAIGRATSLRLLESGWDVDVTGRDPSMFSDDVANLGGRFVASDRHDATQLKSVVGPGADVLVDCACFNADDAQQLLPFARHATSTVVLSSKGVYVDAEGRHSNSVVAPHFAGAISETNATMAPGGGEFKSREGYGANKVAAEHVLLDSGLPVSVLRPSKVHGIGSRRPREWYFVKRILDARGSLLLRRGGAGVDHPSAAANVAALIDLVATKPGARTLNCGDPDVPNVKEMARVIAAHFAFEWEEVMLDEHAPDELGRSPWDAPWPIVLDMSAALALGYVPAGTYAHTVRSELDWLASIAVDAGAVTLPSGLDNEFFAPLFDYGAEDDFLATREGHEVRPRRRSHSKADGTPLE